jgi:HlyD family secretion protein
MTTRSSGSTLWVVIFLVAALAVGAGIWFWKRADDKEITYQTVAVGRGEIAQLVTATGTLNPVTNVTVGSQISGIIQTLNADFNTRVTRGEIVAQLDPATYKANVASAEGDLANANANLELTQVDFHRAEELFKSQLIAKSDYDKAVASLHQAEAAVKMKEASLQRSQVDLSRCTIYAPVDGIVISRNVDVGQTVAASMSAPTLFIIANDLAKMQIDANVAEADVGSVETGQQVEFTVDAFPYRTFRGKVVQVRNSPLTVQNVVTYDTVVEVNNADLKLKPGMTANVSIVIARRDNAVKISNAALRFRPPEKSSSDSKTNSAGASATGQAGGQRVGGGGGNRGERGGGGGGSGGRPRGERSPTRTVYTLGEDGSPKPVQIKIGISDGITTEVTEGLNEGDKVITGSTQAKADAAAPASNPFGGGGFPRR